jgi:hypothetical protein
MPSPSTNEKGRLLAISDLHVAFPENRKFVEELPPSCQDWLLGYPEEAQERPDRPRCLAQILPGRC